MLLTARTKQRILALLLVSTAACTLQFLRLPDANRAERKMTPVTLHQPDRVPYMRLRTLARATRVEDVSSLRFYGPGFGRYHEEEAIRVTDPHLIREFLLDMESAEIQSLPRLDRPDILFIDYKTAPKGLVNPVQLHLNPETPDECFGIFFNQSLGVLGDMEASEMRQAIRTQGMQISEVEFFHHGRSIHVTDAAEIQRLVTALGQANRHLFWNTSAFVDCELVLHRRGAQPLYSILHVGPINPIMPLSQQQIAIPIPLQRYCFQVFQQGP